MQISYTGIYQTQWLINKGKCGVCGDPFSSQFRQNEDGGKFATGKIVRNYTVGQVMPVTIEITAIGQRGFMEFRICHENYKTLGDLQNCLNR